jgi:hypothetical protein
MAMGGIWAALVFPILLLFFRGARDSERAAVRADPRVATGVSVAEGIRSPTFYKLLAASGLFTFTALGIIVHFVPILKDRGAPPLAEAARSCCSTVAIHSVNRSLRRSSVSPSVRRSM